MDSFLFLLRKCKSSSSSNVKGDIFVAASCHGSLPLSPFPPDNIDTKKIWLGPSKVCRVVGSSGSMSEGSLFHTPFSIECENKKSGLSWDHLSCRVRSSCSRGAPSVWAARHARSRIPSRLWHWSSSWPDFNISEGEHACHIVLGHRPYAIGGDWGFPLPKSSPKM